MTAALAYPDEVVTSAYVRYLAVSGLEGGLALITIGTLVPFVFMITALRHIPASRAAIVATAEPVLAALFAFLIHDEALAAVQIAGGLAVVAAVIWVQSQRPDLAAEAAPGPRAA